MQQPNQDPETLQRRKTGIYENAPVHPDGDLLAWERTVIFAPHPDDESLGCGGLIRKLVRLKRSVDVVFITDGAMSHPNSKKYSRKARTALRQREAREACRILGITDGHIHFTDLRDGEVPSEFDPAFAGHVEQLMQLVQGLQPDTFVVPWRRDMHEDHRAVWELCRAVSEQLAHKVKWVEYPVWMWEARNVVDLPREDEMITWALDIEGETATKEQAIRAHRSQWDNVIDDDPQGFRLPDAMVQQFLRPREIYFEPPEKRLRSLDAPYFEAVYRDEADPWNFAVSPYEHAKYQATTEALPDARYRRGLEIGCSVGVLTERLAPYCSELLSVDPVERALEEARMRLKNYLQVTLRQMSVPASWPDGTFDLIVVSEVGYYWNRADLNRAIALIEQSLEPGGVVLLVHYTPYVPDYPLTGDEVHAGFRQGLPGFDRIRQLRADRYRLDAYRKPGGNELHA